MQSATVADFYRRYGRAVFRRARVLLGNDAAAKDAVQDVFVRALRARTEFTEQASPMTWLYRVTTNHCLNLLRDQGRRRDLLAAQGAASSEAVWPHHDERLTMARIVEEVPSELQETAIYHYLDLMSHEEIAELMGVSRRTIGYRLEEFRTRARAVG